MNPPKRAFTRRDLLATVAITLLLAAIQLPSQANTKSSSQSAECASNLRHLIQAWTMYADDNGDRLVPNHGNVAPTGTDQKWANGWLDFTSSFDNINTDYLINNGKNGQ